MLDIRKNSNTTCTALADTYISAIRTIFFGVVTIAQLVEVTDSAVLGGVAEVVSSIPAVGHKIFFSIFWHNLFIIYMQDQQVVEVTLAFTYLMTALA